MLLVKDRCQAGERGFVEVGSSLVEELSPGVTIKLLVAAGLAICDDSCHFIQLCSCCVEQLPRWDPV